MDSNKEKRYENLVNETVFVNDLLKYKALDEDIGMERIGVMAAILVASEHSNEDTSHSYEVIGDESKSKTPGQKMREYRIKHGLSQEKLAKQLGISRPYMSEIESNKRSMSVKTIKIFTDKLGITLSDFFN